MENIIKGIIKKYYHDVLQVIKFLVENTPDGLKIYYWILIMKQGNVYNYW